MTANSDNQYDSVLGKVHDLGQLMFSGMAIPELSFQYLLHRRHSDNTQNSSAKTSSSGYLMMPDHSGTHIDGITHIAYKMRFHGGVDVKSIETSQGYSKLGIEQINPIILPGVMIDLTKTLGDPLPDRYVITEEDLKKCVETLSLKIKPGGCVLVRTGFDRFWTKPEKYLSAPGMSREATHWAAGTGVKVVGADNTSWDLYGEIDKGTGMLHAGHYELLVENEINIIENLNLQSLSEDDCFNFTFICLPLKIKGATGCPVRPVAIS
jgi:kynurenine formamidase